MAIPRAETVADGVAVHEAATDDETHGWKLAVSEVAPNVDRKVLPEAALQAESEGPLQVDLGVALQAPLVDLLEVGPPQTLTIPFGKGCFHWMALTAQAATAAAPPPLSHRVHCWRQ